MRVPSHQTVDGAWTMPDVEFSEPALALLGRGAGWWETPEIDWEVVRDPSGSAVLRAARAIAEATPDGLTGLLTTLVPPRPLR